MTLEKTLYMKKILDIKREKFEEMTEIIKKTKNVKFAHFHIPLTSGTQNALTSLFFPLWLYSALILAVFLMEPKLSDRLSVIAILLIAFVALIP